MIGSKHPRVLTLVGTLLVTFVLTETAQTVGLRDRSAWDVLIPRYRPADVLVWGDVIVVADNGGGLFFFDPLEGSVDVLTTLEGLTSNALTSLATDAEGRLWVGSRGGGVVRISPGPETRAITGLVDLEVHDLATDDDRVYYATSQGVGRVTGGFQERVFTEEDGLLADDVRRVAAYEGRVWFGTVFGVNEYDVSANEILTRNDGLNGSRTVLDLEAGPAGVFVATESGVYALDGEGVWQALPVAPAIPQRIRHLGSRLIAMATADRAFELEDGATSWTVVPLDEEGFDYSVGDGPSQRFYPGPVLGPDGNVWFAAVEETPGLNRGNPVTTLWRAGGSELPRVRGQFGSDTQGVAIDGEGGAWFGTFPVFDGVTHWRADGSVVPYTLEDEDLADDEDLGWIPNSGKIAVFEDSRGDLWVSAFQNGITRLRPSPDDDPAAGEYLHFLPESSPLKSRRVRAMTEDSQGRVWFASDGEFPEGEISVGLDILLDPEAPESPDSWLKVTPDNSQLGGLGVRSVDFDAQGRAWLSVDGLGLQRWDYDGIDDDGVIDPATLTSAFDWRTIDSLPAGGEELLNPRGVVIDGEGFLWLATEGKGIFRFHPEGGLSSSEVDQLVQTAFGVTLLSNQIRSVARDGDGAVWAASDAGLDRIVFGDGSYRVDAFTDFPAFDARDLGSNGYLPDVISPMPGSNLRALAYDPDRRRVFLASQTGSARIQVDVLREPEQAGEGFSLHPNPLGPDDTGVVVSGFDGEATVEIYNLLGVLLQESTSVRENEEVWDARTISGDEVASGLYLVRVITAAGSFQKTLAVER